MKNGKLRKKGKKEATKGIEVQIGKPSECLERKKITSIWEYWKWSLSNKGKMKEIIRKIPQKNKKTSRKQTLRLKSHQENNQFIFEAILKIDKEGTQANKPKDKEIDVYAQDLTNKK